MNKEKRKKPPVPVYRAVGLPRTGLGGLHIYHEKKYSLIADASRQPMSLESENGIYNGKSYCYEQHVAQVEACLLPPAEFLFHVFRNGVGLRNAVCLRDVERVMYGSVVIFSPPSRHLYIYGVALLSLADVCRVLYKDTVALMLCDDKRVGLVLDDGNVLNAFTA